MTKTNLIKLDRAIEFTNMTDEHKIEELLFYGKVLDKKLLCNRFKINEDEINRLYGIYYSTS